VERRGGGKSKPQVPAGTDPEESSRDLAHPGLPPTTNWLAQPELSHQRFGPGLHHPAPSPTFHRISTCQQPPAAQILDSFRCQRFHPSIATAIRPHRERAGSASIVQDPLRRMATSKEPLSHCWSCVASTVPGRGANALEEVPCTAGRERVAPASGIQRGGQEQPCWPLANWLLLPSPSWSRCLAGGSAGPLQALRQRQRGPGIRHPLARTCRLIEELTVQQNLNAARLGRTWGLAEGLGQPAASRLETEANGAALAGRWTSISPAAPTGPPPSPRWQRQRLAIARLLRQEPRCCSGR